MSVSLVTNGSQETTSTNAEGQIVLLIPTVMVLKMETVVAHVITLISGKMSAK